MDKDHLDVVRPAAVPASMKRENSRSSLSLKKLRRHSFQTLKLHHRKPVLTGNDALYSDDDIKNNRDAYTDVDTEPVADLKKSNRFRNRSNSSITLPNIRTSASGISLSIDILKGCDFNLPKDFSVYVTFFCADFQFSTQSTCFKNGFTWNSKFEIPLSELIDNLSNQFNKSYQLSQDETSNYLPFLYFTVYCKNGFEGDFYGETKIDLRSIFANDDYELSSNTKLISAPTFLPLHNIPIKLNSTKQHQQQHKKKNPFAYIKKENHQKTSLSNSDNENKSLPSLSIQFSLTDYHLLPNNSTLLLSRFNSLLAQEFTPYTEMYHSDYNSNGSQISHLNQSNIFQKDIESSYNASDFSSSKNSVSNENLQKLKQLSINDTKNTSKKSKSITEKDSSKKISSKNFYKLSAEDKGIIGVLFFEVIKVTDLPPERNMTKTGFDMDPFVVISLGKRVFRTRIVRHNLNPIYNEKMMFQIFKYSQTYSINISVMDRDKLSSNDFVADVNIDVQNLISCAPVPNPHTGLYPYSSGQILTQKNSDEHSEITNKDVESSFKIKRKKLPKMFRGRKHSQKDMVKSYESTQTNKTNGITIKKNNKPSKTVLDKTPLLGTTSDDNVDSSYSTLSNTKSSLMSSHSFNSTPYSMSNYDDDYIVNESDFEATEDGPEDCDDTMTIYSIEPDKKQSYSSDQNAGFLSMTLPLEMKNKARWEDKHFPKITIRTKYIPYVALRQNFWRYMLKSFSFEGKDTISKIALTSMLESLGSTLSDDVICGFFHQFGKNITEELTVDEAVICLENQIKKETECSQPSYSQESVDFFDNQTQGLNTDVHNQENTSTNKTLFQDTAPTPLSLNKKKRLHLRRKNTSNKTNVHCLPNERIIRINECPICQQPRLRSNTDDDILMHIAACASQDWKSVDFFMMREYVSSKQARRKMLSKVVSKVTHGGYKLGANSANILVQDRITGHIVEENMSIYVRLGIRLLYKGLKRGEMERNKVRKLLASLTIRQGKKYDDPHSVRNILPFIRFHKLNMNECLLKIEQYKNFNEFFYRKLKPNARVCEAADDKRIVVSCADCRLVTYSSIDEATKIWIKGRGFSLSRLFKGTSYENEATRYVNGSIAVFRLAPQDYHRFHSPVDGVVGKPEKVEGAYYTVNPMAIRSHLDVFGENCRTIVPIDSDCFGRIMIVCVGAMMVGSTIITAEAGKRIKKTDELGYFKFGGSTLILIAEHGQIIYDTDLIKNSEGKLETLVRVGMAIGHTPNCKEFERNTKSNGYDLGYDLSSNEELSYSNIDNSDYSVMPESSRFYPPESRVLSHTSKSKYSDGYLPLDFDLSFDKSSEYSSEEL